MKRSADLDNMMVDDDSAHHAKKTLCSEMAKQDWSVETKQFAFQDGEMTPDQE